ncbi:MAG: alanyl-tRNA editing protein [Spirochaetes bacterium]|nr:alanyl-tRNA editing protein [Spirochaetota bacterium]
MSVKKLFWEDPYLTETEAVITGIDGNIVLLDRTVIFAFSGGQHSDSGTINGYQILKAEKKDREIYYTIENNHGLTQGSSVKVLLDWKKRYRLMRLHFAAEIILELINQNYQNPEKIGANISSEKARLDFIWHGNISAIFDDIISKSAVIINSDLPIISSFSDAANEKRYWEVKGFAKVSCGGTHLKRTGEVGQIGLKRNNIGKDKERIEIFLLS